MSFKDDIMRKITGDDDYGRDHYGETQAPKKAFEVPKSYIVGGMIALAGAFGVGSIHTTGDNQVGVKVNKLTGSTEILGAGQTYFFPRVMNDWYELDTKLQNYQMEMHKVKDDKTIDDRLQFKTRDGNDIAMKLTISWMVDPAKADKAIKFVGQSNEEIEQKLVYTAARSLPRDFYGRLSTGEFIVAAKRNAMSREATAALKEFYAPYGILINNVETGDYDFLNEKFKTAVHDMKIAENTLPQVQTAIKTQAQTNLESLNEAQKLYAQKVGEADGTLTRMKVEADNYFLEKQSSAKGTLAAGQNAAAVLVKERQAMAMSGGEAQVMMRLAKNLQGKRIIQVPQCSQGSLNMQTTNVNDFLTTMGIKAVTQGKQ